MFKVSEFVTMEKARDNYFLFSEKLKVWLMEADSSQCFQSSLKTVAPYHGGVKHLFNKWKGWGNLFLVYYY